MTREQPETWQSYLDRRPTAEEEQQQTFEGGMVGLPPEETEETDEREQEEMEITARAIESLL